jgi:magnesium transporter
MYTAQSHDKNSYPEESAGKLLFANIPVVSPTITLGEVLRLLNQTGESFESVNYIYVCNEDGTLIGVFSLKELFAQHEAKTAQEIMTTKPIAVTAKTDQEHVALLSLQHNIKAIPVTDAKGKFLGAVTSDTILRVLHNEGIEDVLRFAGTRRFKNPAKSIISAGAWVHFWKRLPWLIVGLLGGVVAAVVVQLFESTLKEQLLLAAFIPAVVYMADAVGAQAQIIFIRALTLSRSLDMRLYILREIGIGLLLSSVLGALAFAMVSLWVGVQFGIVFGISIVLTILVAMIVAIGLPWALQRLKFDPAIASGPFATVLRDIASILIYFGTAMAFMPF